MIVIGTSSQHVELRIGSVYKCDLDRALIQHIVVPDGEIRDFLEAGKYFGADVSIAGNSRLVVRSTDSGYLH